MTETIFSLRPLVLQDGDAYAAVLAACPDTGNIGSVERFEIDPYQALVTLQKDIVGVVAETPGYDGLVGGGLIRFGNCQWEGQVRPSALLNTLVVHPDYRRLGLASRIARWREEFIRQRQGDKGVMWAVIQHNNTGSEQTARKWAGQFIQNRLAFLSLRMRSTPPPTRPYTVRPARMDELDKVADHLNRYYREYNLYSPESGSSLKAWLAETPFDTPFRHYEIVTDKAGTILAGVALTEDYRVRKIIITHLPAVLGILNRIFHVIPASGELRQIAISRLWYAPGQIEAGRYLVKTIRWEWRQKATSMLYYVDINNPTLRLLNFEDQFGKGLASIAVRAPVACPETGLFYYA